MSDDTQGPSSAAILAPALIAAALGAALPYANGAHMEKVALVSAVSGGVVLLLGSLIGLMMRR